MHFNVIRHYPLITKTTILVVFLFTLISTIHANNNANNNADNNINNIDESLLLTAIKIQVERFNIKGNNPLSATETRRILEQYLGEHQGIEGIEAVADDLQASFKKAGFPFYQVRVPAQSLTTGSIQLSIVQLPIGNIEVRGNRHFSTQNIRQSVPKLQQGITHIDVQTIYRGLDLANRHRSKRTRLTFTTDEEKEQLNATLEVKDYNPVELILSARNTGDESTGDYRTGVTFTHHNLFDYDDGLSMSYVVSPDNASNVKQYDINYRLPFYHLGDEINFTTWRSKSSSTSDLNGAGKIDSIGYTHFFDDSQDYQHQVEVSVQDKFFNNDITPDDDTSNNDVRSRPLKIHYKGRFSTKNTDSDFFLSYRKNLSGGNKNNQSSYELARIGAVQNWSAITVGASVDYWLPKQWLFHAGINGQLTNHALISGEQFGFGGAGSLPGFEEWEVVGDKGYQTKLQLTTPRLYKSLQLFGSYEAGKVKRKTTLMGQANSEVASSIGLGLSTPIGKRCGIKLQTGYVLDGVDDIFEGDSRTRDGDHKTHIDLSCKLL